MNHAYKGIPEVLEAQALDKKYKQMLGEIDNLMIALSKQKMLGLDVEVIIALRNLTKARNTFKREYLKIHARKNAKTENVFTGFLDEVSSNVNQRR
jgi:hypothetical protein